MKQENIYGLHAVKACLETSPDRVLQLHALQSRDDKRLTAILAAAQANGIACETCTRQSLDKLADGGTHQGIVATCRPQPVLIESDIPVLLAQCKKPPFILILDSVQDPHNLGACLRSANAAGIDFVLIPKDKSSPVNHTVRKVACGAAELTPIVHVTNLARAMDVLKEAGVWLYGLAGETDAGIYEQKFDGAVGIVMGAEGDGLRRLTRDKCDLLLSIPMHGGVESLNVSVATGISLFEVMRQRCM